MPEPTTDADLHERFGTFLTDLERQAAELRTALNAAPEPSPAIPRAMARHRAKPTDFSRRLGFPDLDDTSYGSQPERALAMQRIGDAMQIRLGILIGGHFKRRIWAGVSQIAALSDSPGRRIAVLVFVAAMGSQLKVRPPRYRDSVGELDNFVEGNTPKTTGGRQLHRMAKLLHHLVYEGALIEVKKVYALEQAGMEPLPTPPARRRPGRPRRER